MSESFLQNPEPTPEALETAQQAERLQDEALMREGEDRAAEFMSRHPELEPCPVEVAEGGPEVAHFKEMVADFEARFSLADLLAITELTAQEAPNHPLRQPAKLALEPIHAALQKVAGPQFAVLNEEYRRLSCAVGMIAKGGRVTHENHRRQLS